MRYLLNCVYLLLLALLSPLLVYTAWQKGKYRQGFAAKFLGLVPRRASSGECLWLHAVSVGEVNLLAPVLAQLAQAQLDGASAIECVISTTTQTGYALACKKYPRHTVFYCPLDFSWAVAAAMRRVRPTVLVLAELELWPNLIAAAKRRGARVAVINGRLSAKSFGGYRRLRWLIGRVLRRIDLIAVQSETYAERFLALGALPSSVHVTGSVKFDGAPADRNNAATARLGKLIGIEPSDVVLLAGSTQEPEESVALTTYQAVLSCSPQLRDRLRLIIVPRHPERFQSVASMLDASGVAWQRRSELSAAPISATVVPRVLLVDAVGELGAWWGLASIGFVGGSLGSRGGQNMIEPAAYGVAVSFGPNTVNFRDVVAALLEKDAAVVVRDGAELTRFVERCLADDGYRTGLGKRAQALVESQRGATARTITLLAQLLAPGSSRSLHRVAAAVPSLQRTAA